MKFDKPEYNKDDNSTNFLDMKIRIVENQIVTDPFRGYKTNLIDVQFERLRNLPGNNFEEKRYFSLKKKRKERHF